MFDANTASFLAEAAAGQTRSSRPAHSRGYGFVYGAVAVAGWATFSVGSTAALKHGLTANDLTMLRYCGSGLVCLPFIIRAGIGSLGGLGWRRGILLALAAGPLFGGLVNIAMNFAPLSHTATIVPAVSMVASMALGKFVTAERISATRWAGAALIVLCLALLMLQAGSGADMPKGWIGDLLLFAAGALWTAYTFMLRRWAADPVVAVSAVNVISGLAYLPIYLWLYTGSLQEVGIAELGQVFIIQAVIAAFLTIYAYARTVQALGAANAAVFPAAVGPVALTLGVFVLGSIPSVSQTIAVGLATLGLVLAVGAPMPVGLARTFARKNVKDRIRDPVG